MPSILLARSSMPKIQCKAGVLRELLPNQTTLSLLALMVGLPSGMRPMRLSLANLRLLEKTQFYIQARLKQRFANGGTSLLTS